MQFVCRRALYGDAMPHKPKRPCSHPGCPKLTDGRFCEEHAKEEAQRYERYQRDPAVKKRYGRTWKRIRDRFITAIGADSCAEI